jgi:hypothetical protein
MAGLSRREKKKETVPELSALLEARDYTGAITLIEFERKMFMDKKQASGWRAGSGGEYEWVEGGSASLTAEEAKQDEEKSMWLAYAAFHLGNYKQALDAYQSLLDKGSDDAMLHVYMACCLERLGWHTEAEERALKGPACPLQNRLLFHLAHRLNDENKLMMHHQKLADTTLDQLSLASIHFLRNHFQEATDIYKRLLLENRDYTALNVYVALCYYKLDYCRRPARPNPRPHGPQPQPMAPAHGPTAPRLHGATAHISHAPRSTPRLSTAHGDMGSAHQRRADDPCASVVDGVSCVLRACRRRVARDPRCLPASPPRLIHRPQPEGVQPVPAVRRQGCAPRRHATLPRTRAASACRGLTHRRPLGVLRALCAWCTSAGRGARLLGAQLRRRSSRRSPRKRSRWTRSSPSSCATIWCVHLPPLPQRPVRPPLPQRPVR